MTTGFFKNKQKTIIKPSSLTSPVAVATAHTLSKMREQIILWLTLTLAKNGPQSNAELGIGSWKLCSATLIKKQKLSQVDRDAEFLSSRKFFEGKARNLQEPGMGKRPNKAQSLNKEEEEILWEDGQLGDKKPRSLINTVWWLLKMNFGLRGRQEHHDMILLKKMIAALN